MTEPAAKVSYREYLAQEAASGTKHEYIDGVVVAMAGGTVEHGRLASEVAFQLRRQLERTDCRVLSSDVRIRIAATDRSTYPDVSVVCGEVERAGDDAEAVVNPTVIVEVLSDSTERSDRGEKWAHYRRLPSLQHYLLVSQDQARVEVYSRSGEIWEFRDAGSGEQLHLAHLEVDIDIDALYRARV